MTSRSHGRRRRRTIRNDLILAALPALTIVGALAFFDALVKQRLLFSSLAASAFLVWVEPRHPMNAVRTVLLSQLVAALDGALAFTLFGNGLAASGAATAMTAMAMIALDAVHPPAISTTFGFAMRAGRTPVGILFALVAVVTGLIIVLHQAAEFILNRIDGRSSPPTGHAATQGPGTL